MEVFVGTNDLSDDFINHLKSDLNLNNDVKIVNTGMIVGGIPIPIIHY